MPHNAMNDDLVDVYEAQTLFQAKLVSDMLEGQGVRCFIDNVDSPLDGLVAADQVKIVRVLPQDAQRARRLVDEFNPS